ncbi:hypothetical protein [Streptomyces sp. 8N616]|uniref:hypothetical protein n=1 Tax=Streptomyces sp. 8N616 TaxID=3457414 RepID=UPI003FD44DFB
MTMAERSHFENYIGMKVVSYDGQYLGEIGSVFASSAASGIDRFIAAISPERERGRRLTLWKTVPLSGARERAGAREVVVPYGVDRVKTAPEFSVTPRELDAAAAREISLHFDLSARLLEGAVNLLLPEPSTSLGGYLPGAHDRKSGAATSINGADPEIDQPLPGNHAWSDRSEIGAWSQAAQLVGLGIQLTGHSSLLGEWQEEARILLLPNVGPFDGRGTVVAAQTAFDRLGLSLTAREFLDSPDCVPEEHRSEIQEILWVESHLNDYGASREAAIALLLVSLSSPHEIVRAVVASELSRFSEVSSGVIDVLLEGCRSLSTTVCDISANALARIGGHCRLLSDFQNEGEDIGPETSSHTSITVHGTWARFNAWWRPDSELASYIRGTCSSDLWNQASPFSWGGGYKNDARQRAGGKLRTWTGRKRINCLETVYAHSHGANVAFYAALEGVNMRLLVLLHPAIVRRSRFDEDRILESVGRVIAFTTCWDLVVLADRAHRFFPSLDPRLEETRSGWFSHRTFTKQSVWESKELPDVIDFERGLVDPNFPVPSGSVA